MPLDIAEIIGKRLNLPRKQVASTLRLLDDGATIPFIARYRKEMTGSLDEVALNNIRTQAEELEELEKRKEFVADAIEKSGAMTDDLMIRLAATLDPAEVEDIYLPFKPRRRTRAEAARQFGLEPLAKQIMSQRMGDVVSVATRFVGGDIADADAAIVGASDIIAEWVSENKKARMLVRQRFARNATINARVIRGKEADAVNYQNYYNFSKSLRLCGSHNYLAMRRGEEEGLLRVSITIDDDEIIERLGRLFVKSFCAAPVAEIIRQAVADGYRRLLKPAIENEVAALTKKRADDAAISIFAENVRHLLMEPPLGRKRVMGIDPGFKSGCKVACIDEQGALLATDTIYPCAPVGDVYRAADTLCMLVGRLGIDVIAVGDGTASRETMTFLSDITFPRNVAIQTVSERGASVYSASDCARREFPQLDVTLRGAVSIARRLLDPLAELVKIDPKSIGVGQYQHDVNQAGLKRALDFTVESCVNAVGVDVNTASPELLAQVSGIGNALSNYIVEYRTANGQFRRREQLLEVPRMGRKAYEQCAAFLRINGGDNPLDSTGVHPESYPVVARMAADAGVGVNDLIRNKTKLEGIEVEQYVDKNVGLPTLRDIISELEKPARDPRVKDPEPVIYSKDVAEIADLHIGQELTGRVTNLTAFGAFVDIGLKVNGLVHISQLSERFVSNPAELLKVGQAVKVKVIDVDAPRGRVALTMKGVGQ